MKTQEIQLRNGERFEIVNSSIPMTQELMRSVIDTLELERSPYIEILTYQSLDTKGCTATVNATLAGTITITKCPTNSVPGTTVTVGATATNTGNVANNSFVILITASRSDNGAILAQGTSTNMNLTVGAISTEFTISYIAPGVDVNVSYTLQADPLFNY